MDSRKKLSTVYASILNLNSHTNFLNSRDRTMGGISVGNLAREFHAGRISNVLRGKVILQNQVGFIQMVTNLAQREQGADIINSVDASRYDGIEIDVYNGIESPTGSENFNLQ